jgi:hypothetical protein
MDRNTGRPRSLAAWLAPVVAVIFVALWLGLSGVSTADGSPVGPLALLRCTSMASDPAVEAPLYAQDEGANGSPDGWWCQLPHGTKLPVGFVQLQRTVAPLANSYALFITRYGMQGGTAGTSGSSTHQPHIVISVNVNSSVTPPAHLQDRQALHGGKRIALASGVPATMVTHGTRVTLTWRFPPSGVPKYLRGVATIRLSASGVPETEVIDAARDVQPD